MARCARSANLQPVKNFKDRLTRRAQHVYRENFVVSFLKFLDFRNQLKGMCKIWSYSKNQKKKLIVR
ncbi:unnamed protein product [Acanthoscelides obtectus]|uniref:Uncharacterized protein n=1 Tax=Acanthoscelides obtectus TaxID=200917 RepID=A0A9P0LJ82_ACAOB|nr:unnamed protein product [Acanthoscelides obtectus]CAK1621454.1 hypothetical protein AOBTE_LOCUS965 [Acanthoscelides obtectus]